MTYSRRLLVVAFAATALALSVLAPAAAASVRVGGGSTALKLDSGLASALSDAGVTVSPGSPARAGRGGVSFPITGGRVDSSTARGVFTHSGSLTFAAGGKRVTLRSLRVRIGKRRGSLSARVGRKRIPVLVLGLRGARLTRSGFGTRVSRVRAHLNGQAARALNRAFGVSLLRADQAVGRVTLRVRPSQIELRRRGSTDLTVDPGAASALQSLGISASPVSPARVAGGALSFPVTGGKLDARTYAGTIRHSGGIALTRGSTRVELTRFTINVDSQPDLVASVGGSRVSILSLDLAGLKAAVQGRRVTLSGVKVRLTKAAADALNQAFGTSAFQEGLTLGSTVTRVRAR